MSDRTRDFSPQKSPTADAPPGADTHSAGEATADPVGAAGESDGLSAPPGYELLEEIGRGGMGIVFRGRGLSLNRHVALKFLQARYAPNSLAARRFLDEARITGQLQHPGIPPVHEVGELPDGRPYLVMKLIKGETLAELLDKGSLGRGALVAVFEQVCQAVAYAHNHGVVHRDLKPANVMVGAFGEVQVMDWGLAKFRGAVRPEDTEASVASTFHDPRGEDSEDLRTRTGSFLGTPAYMAPEQAIGAVDRIDERSDVFGLGAVLCTILTGSPPFVGPTPEATRQLAAQGKLGDAFARLYACEAEPELVALCKWCLAVDPSDRLPNAGAVAKAVAALRQAADERARQAELDRVRAEGERAKAEAKAGEQRKRLWTELRFYAMVMLALGWWWVSDWQDRIISHDRKISLPVPVAPDKGNSDGAITGFKNAITLDPNDAEAHCNLGHALRSRGRLIEAAEMLRKGHELGSRRPGWAYPSAQWVADCEKLLAERGLVAPPPRPVKP